MIKEIRKHLVLSQSLVVDPRKRTISEKIKASPKLLEMCLKVNIPSNIDRMEDFLHRLALSGRLQSSHITKYIEFIRAEYQHSEADYNQFLITFNLLLSK